MTMMMADALQHDPDALRHEPDALQGRSRTSEVDSPPLKRVVGLRYDAAQGLPQIILKGAGPLAEELLRRRDRHLGPQVVRNEALLQSLYRLPVDSNIGPDLFRIVAVVLAHVFAVDHERAHSRGLQMASNSTVEPHSEEGEQS